MGGTRASLRRRGETHGFYFARFADKQDPPEAREKCHRGGSHTLYCILRLRGSS